MDIPLGEYALGEISRYDNVAVDLAGVAYGAYAMAVNIYVKGGSYPIPTSGKDYMGLQDITISGRSTVVAEPFELEVLVY